MKSKSILVLLAVLFTTQASQVFAQENGVCFVLTMKYTEQHPIYTASKYKYETATDSVGYGSPTLTKSQLKQELDKEKTKLDKITNALKASGCFSNEDETNAQAQLKK